MNEKEVLKIKEYVKSPLTGSITYGKWDALTPEQRNKINRLCDSWLIINNHDMFLIKSIKEEIEKVSNVDISEENFVHFIKKLEEILNLN